MKKKKKVQSSCWKGNNKELRIKSQIQGLLIKHSLKFHFNKHPVHMGPVTCGDLWD